MLSDHCLLKIKRMILSNVGRERERETRSARDVGPESDEDQEIARCGLSRVRRQVLFLWGLFSRTTGMRSGR